MSISSVRQGGFSFPGFIAIVLAVVVVMIMLMRVLPAYIEDNSIHKIFDAIVHDPDMKDAKISDIRMSFSKRAMVSDVTAVNSDDIDIQKDDSGLTLSASYSVKLHLIGNINLLIDFNPSVPDHASGS